MDDVIMVSISCVTYNHVEYIEQAICGFLMQRTDFKFEILIHDDCSTDGTQEIIKKYEKLYPDIIFPIFQKENQYSKGLSVTYSFQYPRARGKYIAICEGDDYWIDPLKLQKQVDFLEANSEYILCGTNGVYFNENINSPSRLFNIVDDTGELTMHDIISSWNLPTAGLLFRKKLIDRTKDFNANVYSGDKKMLLCAIHNGRIMFLNRLSVVYRKNYKDSSASARLRKKKNVGLEYAKHCIELYTYFNAYSKGKYKQIIAPIMGYWKAVVVIQEDKNKYGYISYLLHLLLFFKYILPSFLKRRKYARYEKSYCQYRKSLIR